jgi:hypothetical protein
VSEDDDERENENRWAKQLRDERVMQDDLLARGRSATGAGELARAAIAYWLGEFVQYIRERGFR